MNSSQIELVDIVAELYESTQVLKNGSQKLFQLALKKAETERDYRKSLAVQIITLKDMKMAVTLIPDIARGNTSDLKFERDLAEARYVSARDRLNAVQSQMNGLQSIVRIQREVEPLGED